MIRTDRELLATLARLNTDVVRLAMRIMDQSVTADEQHAFAERLIAMAAQLQVRASKPWTVVEGDVVPTSDDNTGAAQHRER
ncbi:MAG: hypothetical protein M3R63_05655 [Actinomycetota bacterium]|nr:hypothetical protein [Actinomycetota bacterium]